MKLQKFILNGFLLLFSYQFFSKKKILTSDECGLVMSYEKNRSYRFFLRSRKETVRSQSGICSIIEDNQILRHHSRNSKL